MLTALNLYLGYNVIVLIHVMVDMLEVNRTISMHSGSLDKQRFFNSFEISLIMCCMIYNIETKDNKFQVGRHYNKKSQNSNILNEQKNETPMVI